MTDDIIVFRQNGQCSLCITPCGHFCTDLIDPHAVLISTNRSPFITQRFCNQAGIPVHFIGILLFIIVHEIRAFHYRNQPIFSQNLHGKFCNLRCHLFVKKSLPVFLNGRSTGTDHSGKRNLLQIPGDKSPASSCAEPCFMSIIYQRTDGFNGTVRHAFFHITDCSVRIKKHCFSAHFPVLRYHL